MSATRGTLVRRVVLAVLLTASVPTGVAAQKDTLHWLAFRGALGAEAPHGDASRVFQGNIRGEFSILAMPKTIGGCPFYPGYFGFGFGWVSYPVQPGYGDEEWNYVGPHFIAGLSFREWSELPFYIELRVDSRRLRPQRQQDFEIHSDHYRKERPYPEYRAAAAEGVVGVDIKLKTKVYLSVSGHLGTFGVKGEINSDQMTATLKGSWVAGMQAGVLWFP